LIVSWSPTEASSLSEAQRLGADPYFHRALPLDEMSGAALQASAIAASLPTAHELAAPIAVRNRANGKKAYPQAVKGDLDEASVTLSRALRWPITEGMISMPVTGAVAVVIASEDFVEKNAVENVAWVKGMGWATEAGFLGDRDLSIAPALEEARRRAYNEAGIDDARTAFDLVELTDASPYQELLVYEALGISRRDDWKADILSGLFESGGKLPINPSGGVTAINPVFCTGLIRIAEAANQVRNRAGPHQIANARTALAHAASGFAMMYQTVLVLGSDDRGAQA
jgi:acetyl-CoA C-acetyltransferase